MAHDSAKGLRQQLEDGLLADHPLRCLIEGALLVAINNTHYVWDRDVAKYRDEAVAARKRLPATPKGQSRVVIESTIVELDVVAVAATNPVERAELFSMAHALRWAIGEVPNLAPGLPSVK